MSNLKKPVPLSILFLITITATVTLTVEAAKTGALNFFGVGPVDNEPIINGTIINYDNKTYGIVIVPTGNATIPDIPPVNDTIPPVVVPPVNDTQPPIVNDTQPPVVNETGETINVIMVGDIYGSTGKQVAQAIKDRDPEFVPILGDLGYDDDGQYLQEVYGPLGNKIGCVIGNHDEGVSEIEQYCQNDWYTIMNTVLFIGLNTDGNVNTQRDLAVALLKDSEFMENITSVHIMSHFPWKAPPNSHHPEDEDSQAKAASAAIQSIINAVPTGVKIFSDNGHNHGLAEGNVNGVVVHQSGGGGRSLYDCDTNAAFPYCDNVYGFLEYVIEPDGDTTWAFYNQNGGKIR